MPRVSYNDVEAVTPSSGSVGSAQIVDGSIVAVDVADGAITLAKLASLATNKLIGRSTAGTGVPEAIDLSAAGRALIDDASADAQLTTLGVTAAAKTILDDTTVAAMRATLGLEIHAEYIFLGRSPEEGIAATDGVTVVGGSPLALDPATYARTGLTAAFHLVGTAYTDDVARTGTLTLWDVTTDAAVATATWSNATTPAAFTPATATLNATAHVYELRLSCSGTLNTHRAFLNNASLRITWS